MEYEYKYKPVFNHDLFVQPVIKTYDSLEPSIDDYKKPILVTQHLESVKKEEETDEETSFPIQSVEFKQDYTLNKPSELIPSIYTCFFCKFESKYKWNFIKHLDNHRGWRPFTCYHCQYRANTKQNIIRHLWLHGSIYKFKCEKCDFKTNEKVKFTRHNIRQHQLLKCLDCAYIAHNKLSLVRHCKYHNFENIKFKCRKCNVSCADFASFTVHMHNSHNENVKKCSECNYSTSDSCKLKMHIDVIHTGRHLFYCNICNYGTFSRKRLLGHLTSHSGKKTFPCNICDYTCLKRSVLEKHKTVHIIGLDVKKFNCDECDYVAADKRYVEKHKALRH